MVALRAYSSSVDERLMLYDYYSNGSMHLLLHGMLNSIDSAQISLFLIQEELY